MYLFLERLKEIGVSILFIALALAAFFLFIALPIKILEMISLTLAQWVVGIAIVAVVLFWIYYFLNWLIIEPFFKNKRTK